MMDIKEFMVLSDEEKKKVITSSKNDSKKSNDWKVYTILYVTNGLDQNNIHTETKFYKGKYQTVFKNKDVTFDEIEKYVYEIKNTEIYDSVKQYIETVRPKIKSEEIRILEERISSGIMSEEEEKHIKMTKLNKTLTKIITAVIIAGSIYMVLYLLLTMFGYSFR